MFDDIYAAFVSTFMMEIYTVNQELYSILSDVILQWVDALVTIVEKVSSHLVVCHATVQGTLYY